MLIRTLLDAQKEIFKQELKEQSEMNSYLLQAKSTLARFGEELNVLESIYIQNNIKNAEKYPTRSTHSLCLTLVATTKENGFLQPMQTFSSLMMLCSCQPTTNQRKTQKL